jgi:hypothetical protein
MASSFSFFPRRLTAAALLSVAQAAWAQPPDSEPALHAAIEAQFRGCDAAGWCRFWIEPGQSALQAAQRVRPNGVLQPRTDAVLAVAVRDRLNALLASMIHQHKRIELHNLRALDDGTCAATVTVNGADGASDPVLLELRAGLAESGR